MGASQFQALKHADTLIKLFLKSTLSSSSSSVRISVIGNTSPVK